MERITLKEFQDRIRAQGHADRLDAQVVCPMCKTVQSARDFIAAGVGTTLEDVYPYVGFSCIGRWTGAGTPRNKPDGKPCNLTLGGLFKTHKMEVELPDGEIVATFAPAPAGA